MTTRALVHRDARATGDKTKHDKQSAIMYDIQHNKQLVRDYFTAFVARDMAWWQAHVATEFVRHDPGLDFVVRGPAGLHRLADILHGGIADMQLPIADLVAEDDRVLARLRVKGRHTGELMGRPASGHVIDVAVMDLFRFDEQRRLVEHWALIDHLSLQKQLGGVPD